MDPCQGAEWSGEQGRPEGQVAVAGGGGEEGFALGEGHEQQLGLAGFVPEDAFAVDPGGVVAQDAKGGFDFGAACSGRERAGAPAGPKAAGEGGDRCAQLLPFTARPLGWNP